MLLTDFLTVPATRLLEYGRQGFPGFGRRLFGQRHYEYMVTQLLQVSDAQAREWLTDWLSRVFKEDNGKFDSQRFAQAVQNGRVYNASPTFEQRHFYYLAYWVKALDDPHIHDFVLNWLADSVGRTNYNFKRSRWDQFTARNETPPVNEPDPSATAPVEEQYGGAPGFGSRSHGGFGKKVFRKRQVEYIAWELNHIEDPAIRDHLTTWCAQILQLDNPDFKPDAFAQLVASSRGYRPSAQFQSRHFYFLAHEVAEIADVNEREFVCDWLADAIGRTNQYFNDERWRKFCNLEPESYERRNVAHYRAKARGDANPPETPWQERQRLEREAATVLTPEQFHAVATSHAEATGELNGHDLVYLRMTDGEYKIYDKTTGNEHWAIEEPNYQWNH